MLEPKNRTFNFMIFVARYYASIKRGNYGTKIMNFREFIPNAICHINNATFN